MEQKKKKQEDVLVVRDEKTGEISVVAGLDARGYPKRAQAKAEHSQEFLRFDRHGDAIDNFFKNFYRQCKEPTRFGFYRVAADTVEALLPVIKDLLKDPVANADLLAPHKVDTSAHQQAEEQQAEEEVKKENAETETEEQQAAEEAKKENAETEAEEQQATEEVKRENAETETEEQQAAEEVKRENAGTEAEEQQNAEEVKRENTEENNVEQQTNEKMEKMKLKNQEQQPQAAESQAVQEPAQDGQPQAKTQRPNLIADGDVDWKELERFGVKKENLSEKDMKALMNYGKTNLVTVNPTFGGDSYEMQARLSFQKTEDGKMKLAPHFVRHEPRLDIPYNGYTFTDEDKKNLKQTGNLGRLVDVADTKTGEMRPSYISIDRLTNEIVDIPASKVRIPDRIGLTELLKPEQDILRAGLALPKEVTLKNGRKFEAVLQVSAEKRDVEFVPEHLWQGQSQRRGNGQEKKQKSQETPDTPGQQQKEAGSQENGQRSNRSWTNEDGSIRPIGKWKDDKFTEQQKADYVAGKVVVLANAKDDQGQPCTKYLKFDREKGRPLTYSANPDLAQTVAPSNESRTQLAVNNEGKTNEATKHLKEPLTQGQTAPKDDAQKKQQTKKSKGMKVS
ncbi:DUF4099 domain-containing protein [Phocaeicola vulgatus]|uniref:DUF4099 domain-containing protein n=1 Tax=Phocaeicola vulgatus TaxID=821 RepID=UPI00189C8C29|nr:DUF4099 domain-containing protein [Phocaeicola vulgatus]